VRLPSWRRWLAGAAALAGALASLAGSPYHRAMPGPTPGPVPGSSSAPGSINVAELARVVADQEDHVSAVQLAAWIRERLPGLRVIDVRSAPEFRAYHIPGAEHVPLEALATTRFAPDETLVLYSEAGAHGAQAWVFLCALGHRRVFFLRSGLHEWLDDVMSPTIAADAPVEAQAAFAQVAELSRFFGGMPRRLGGSTPALPEDAPVTGRRRGC
jgi:rhodanese-related sulfurtransferase